MIVIVMIMVLGTLSCSLLFVNGCARGGPQSIVGLIFLSLSICCSYVILTYPDDNGDYDNDDNYDDDDNDDDNDYLFSLDVF